MRRILSFIAALALMMAFAMPVVTADAASHEKMKDSAEQTMKKGEEEGKKAMDKMDKMKPENPCNPCNPCAKKEKK
jgi:hypothetical protein